jgi:large conductance mechanosensitive channel
MADKQQDQKKIGKTREMLKDFKTFALKGNVIDLAVGVIIGTAFGKIVTSLVNDVIMPLIGLITGGTNFQNMFVLLRKIPANATVTTLDDAKALNIPTLSYGAFLSQVLDFIIIALVIFMIIRMITRLSAVTEKRLKKTKGMQEPEPVALPATKECPYCRTTIHIDAVRCPNCTSKLD